MHILFLDDVLKLFRDIRISTLDVIAVNGVATRADRQGQLVVTLNCPDEAQFTSGLGTAHAMR